MKTHRIRLTKDAEKSLLKISQSLPAIGHKIGDQIESLKNNPHLGTKLQGSDQETRRVRVGDYRIIYEVYEHHLVILVIYIGPRSGKTPLLGTGLSTFPVEKINIQPIQNPISKHFSRHLVGCFDTPLLGKDSPHSIGQKHSLLSRFDNIFPREKIFS